MYTTFNSVGFLGGPTNFLVIVDGFDGIQGRDAAQESTTTSGNNALFNSSPGGVQSIGHSVFLLIHLNVARPANL